MIQEEGSWRDTPRGRMGFFRMWCDTQFSTIFKKTDFADEDRYKKIRSSLLKLAMALYPPTGSGEETDHACWVYSRLCMEANSLCKDDFATESTEDK